MKILLAEDEANIRETIALNLRLDGYEVVFAEDGIEALKHFRAGRFDLIILDVMMPQLSGFDVCQEIRKEDTSVPVLFLTARNTGEERVQGLRLGADDYLAKPFNLEELMLRVAKLVKRNAVSKPAETYSFDQFEINFATFEISGPFGKVEVGRKEMGLLRLLTARPGQVVSREEILDEVWGKDVYPSSRTIDNYILAFRKIFEQNPREPRYFHSIRGVGYKFTP